MDMIIIVCMYEIFKELIETVFLNEKKKQSPSMEL